MNKSEIQEKLIGFLCSSFSVDREDIELSVSLVDQGIIDSMGLIEISSHLKREHGIEIVETDLNVRNFGSVEAIVEFVYAKCLAAAAERQPVPTIAATAVTVGADDAASRAALQREALAQQRRSGIG